MNFQNITKLVAVVAFAFAITFGTVAFAEEVGDPMSSSTDVEAITIFTAGSGGGC